MAIIDTSIGLSEFSFMSEEERGKRVNALRNAAISPNAAQIEDWIKQINNEIHMYESQYKMSSGDLLQSLQKGKALNFPKICSWIALLKTRDQIEQKYRRSYSQ